MKTVMYSHRYLSACSCKLLSYMLRDFVAAEGMANGHAVHEPNRQQGEGSRVMTIHDLLHTHPT